LLANSPKDSPLSSAESCALYYFPEIPSRQEKGCATPSTPGQFVSGALERCGDRSSLGAKTQDQVQIQQLVEEAFNKGMDQGRAETTAAFKEKVDKGAAALKIAVEEMARIRQQDVERMESETVRLALAIAKKVIGHETEHGPVISHVLKAAMNQVADSRHLTVRLNPKDIDTVNGFKQELLLADDFGSVLRLEADEMIQQGGCIIETKLGDLDARIDQQIKIIEELLNDQLPKHIPGD
jgi:flagellar assembly protein FliH